MITVRDVMEVMERWAPSALVESWDNPGLMTGAPDDSVTAALLALDVLPETVEIARRTGCSLIISHHPPIFTPLRSLAGTDMTVQTIRAAIRDDIAIYASHTNLDQAPGGVSASTAAKLGLTSIVPLSPGKAGKIKFIVFVPAEHTDRVREAAGRAGAGVIGEYRSCSFTVRGTGTYLPSDAAHPFTGETGTLSREPEDRIEMIAPALRAEDIVAAVRAVHPYEEMAYDIVPLANNDSLYGYGAIGDLEPSMTGEEFIRHTTRTLGVETVAVSGNLSKSVRRVAVMGGSGGRFIGDAVSAGADAFVTGDIGYHDFLAAPDSLLLIDASHRATELPVLESISRRLLTHLSEEIRITIDSGTAHARYVRSLA